MNNSIRLRTTPGVDKNIQVKIEQDFDFLEVLSLKIGQSDVYNSFCADYGTVVGRVIANNGYGVPNAKVVVFIPITDEDVTNDLIRDLYPYRDVTDKNSEGIRFNILPSEVTCDLNTPVGTFPTKDQVLTNDIMIEVFDKYYKYTTKTNDSGDYMIFGVPTGQQTVQTNVDLSEAGPFSPRPYDFIDNKGFSEKLFKSRTEYASSKNLDELPQIKIVTKSVEVLPFWGDEEQCSVGITRVDFDTNFDFEPNAIYTGSLFTDQDKNSLNKGCNPTNDQGNQCELRTGAGFVDVIRVEDYVYGEDEKIVPTSLSNFTPPQGFDSIDEDGNFVLTLPMNVGHVITNEEGQLVPTNDPSKGIPTKGLYRFRMGMSQATNGKRRTATVITPSLNRVTGGNQISLGSQPSTENARWTTDLIDGWYNGNNLDENVFYNDFHEFTWNQIYTISQYIPKYKKGGNRFSFLGLKGVDECGDTNTLPFNNAVYSSDIIYGLLSFFIRIQAIFLKFLIAMNNFALCFVFKFNLLSRIIGFLGGSGGITNCELCGEDINGGTRKYRDGDLKDQYIKRYLPLENVSITDKDGRDWVIDKVKNVVFAEDDTNRTNYIINGLSFGNDTTPFNIDDADKPDTRNNSISISNISDNTPCDTKLGNYTSTSRRVWVKVNLTSGEDNKDGKWINLGRVGDLPVGIMFRQCEGGSTPCLTASLRPFGFLVGNNKDRELPCESSGPITVSNTCSEGGCGTLCDEITGSFGIKLGVVTPKCCTFIEEDGSTGTLPESECGPEDNCDSMCAVDSWLCCAIFDLAIRRQVIRYTFYDAWMNGSVYLPQFKIKQRIKNQGKEDEFVVDRFCGPGSDNGRGDNYKKQRCDLTRGVGSEVGIVRGPNKPDKDKNQFTPYHMNDYDTGASDSGDFIYTPEMLPTKIVNIGRVDACDSVIETISRLVNGNSELITLYKTRDCGSEGNDCYQGVGYDTEQWTDTITNTSYNNPALMVINHLQRGDKRITCRPKNLFKGGAIEATTTSCDEFELRDEYWKELHEVSKLYVDIVTDIDESGNEDITVFGGLSYDKGPNEKFHPSAITTGSGYPSSYSTQTNKPYDVKLADRSNGHHFKNNPYFYFGINPGKTAMDKLRRLYLSRK